MKKRQLGDRFPEGKDRGSIILSLLSLEDFLTQIERTNARLDFQIHSQVN